MEESLKARYFRLVDFVKQLTAYYQNMEDAARECMKIEAQRELFDKSAERVMKEVKPEQQAEEKKKVEHQAKMFENAAENSKNTLVDSVVLMTKKIEMGVK